MILSAMMFALGVFVTGLLALGFSVALVRRTRRVTERRIMAAVTVRRADFEAERDELRARHAVQMHRLEREIARVLDMATAHRLEADVKDRDLLNAKAEMNGLQQELEELNERLGEQRSALQEVERKYAESSTSLRAARHALTLESRRRAGTGEPAEEPPAVADEKQDELIALRAQVEALRVDFEQARRTVAGAMEAPAASQAAGAAQPTGRGHPPRLVAEGMDARAPSVVPLPIRARPGQIGEAVSGWRATEPVAGEPEPDGAAVVGDASANPQSEAPDSLNAGTPSATDGSQAAQAAELPASDTNDDEAKTEQAETLFVEALAEIRELKRAAGTHAAE